MNFVISISNIFDICIYACFCVQGKQFDTDIQSGLKETMVDFREIIKKITIFKHIMIIKIELKTIFWSHCPEVGMFTITKMITLTDIFCEWLWSKCQPMPTLKYKVAESIVHDLIKRAVLGKYSQAGLSFS